MKKLLALLLLPLSAFAGSATVSWVHPLTYTDGSTLPLADIQQTRVEYGTCAGTAFGVKAGEVIVTGTATSTVINNLAAGTWCFRGFSKAKNLESATSNISSKVVPQAPPNPPTITTVEVVAGVGFSPAFKILASGSRSAAVAGFVASGKACTGPVVFTYRGKSYRRVNPSDVKWWNTTASSEVAAACA